MPIETAQVTITTAPTMIVALRGRNNVTVTQNGTGVPVYIGNSNVTVTTGIPIAGVPGAAITVSNSAALYGVTASGSTVVSSIEDF